MTRGWSTRNASTRGPARTRQRSGRRATTSAIGDSPRRIETSPKKSPRARRARSVPSIDDRRLAVEDHVEAGAGQALAQDPLALGEDRLLEGVDDPGELRVGQVGEQGEAGDRVDQLLATDHGAHGARRGRRAAEAAFAC